MRLARYPDRVTRRVSGNAAVRLWERAALRSEEALDASGETFRPWSPRFPPPRELQGTIRRDEGDSMAIRWRPLAGTEGSRRQEPLGR
jgi:hypothetical protein